MMRITLSACLMSFVLQAGSTCPALLPISQRTAALAISSAFRSTADNAPIKWELVDSTALEAKRPHMHYRRVKVPKIYAYLDVARAHGRTLARFVLRWTPNTAIHLTRVHHPAPTERLVLSTNQHGMLFYYFDEPDPPAPHHTTVTVRVWGVFYHHRRTAVLRFRLGPAFPPAAGVTTISTGPQGAAPMVVSPAAFRDANRP